VTIPRHKFVLRASVYAVILQEGKILLVRHQSSGKHFLPGGGIEIGEPIREALKRELREEAGMQVEVARLFYFKEHFFYHEPADQAYHNFMVFFWAKETGKVSRTSANAPHTGQDETFWADLSALKREDFHSSMRDVFDLLGAQTTPGSIN